MKLEKSVDKIDLKSSGIISTETSVLDESFKNEMAYITIGAHDIDEFYNRPFYYLDWNSNEKTKDFNGYRCTYAILRSIQDFIFDLWQIKDNNIYVFSGFLFEYDKVISDGSTFKGTVTATMSKSKLEKSGTLFTEVELKPAIEEMSPIVINELLEQDSDYFTPTSDHFFKSSGIDRIGRASYFVLEARSRHTFPTKIVSYITAIECLFTTSQTELSHRASERVATLKGGTKESKLETYRLLKKAYDVRSKVVHGAILKGQNEELKEISTGLDQLLREFLSEKNEIFTKSNEQIDSYFLNQLF
ncbi:MAG: hypothetical protein COA33_013710 [Fluviicola sp.]|nr:hypothetical protein [Fluviicola sp.]